MTGQLPIQDMNTIQDRIIVDTRRVEVRTMGFGRSSLHQFEPDKTE